MQIKKKILKTIRKNEPDLVDLNWFLENDFTLDDEYEFIYELKMYLIKDFDQLYTYLRPGYEDKLEYELLSYICLLRIINDLEYDSNVSALITKLEDVVDKLNYYNYSIKEIEILIDEIKNSDLKGLVHT